MLPVVALGRWRHGVSAEWSLMQTQKAAYLRYLLPLNAIPLPQQYHQMSIWVVSGIKQSKYKFNIFRVPKKEFVDGTGRTREKPRRG